MHIFNLLKVSWNAILLNKVRAFLTMLGVIIGVASVITMLAIGEGSKASIKAEISKMGTNMITIRAGSGYQGGVKKGESVSLSIDDLNAIRKEAKFISYLSPEVSGNGQLINGAKNWPANIYGVSPEYLDIKAMQIASGNMFTDRELKTVAKVAVIGKTVLKNLFEEGENPIGKTIRFNKIPFTIIGVLESKGMSSWGQDQDDIVIAPYTTVQKRILASADIRSIQASAISEEKALVALEEVLQIMRKQHKIAAGKEDDFNVRSMDELISSFEKTGEVLTILLVVIASISLFIGGIGIMNIMYVSVKERTREIGLRMAVGGKSKDILIQFLIEAILISVTGGLIGVLLGLTITELVTRIVHWPTLVTSFSVVVSFLVCAFTGIFFGWYPAKKAASLDPIQALRYE